VDALELFSGLIMFCQATFDDKIRFLFKIFDFNEFNSLSMIDLEFMIISCSNATFKIYNASGVDVVINEEEIKEVLSKYFDEDSRINIS